MREHAVKAGAALSLAALLAGCAAPAATESGSAADAQPGAAMTQAAGAEAGAGDGKGAGARAGADAAGAQGATGASATKSRLSASSASRVAQTADPLPGSSRPIPDAKVALSNAQAAYARGLAWILANQRPDGSFGTFESPRANEVYLDTQSSHRAFHTATTALVCWSLMSPARGNTAARAALERGLAWLEAQGEIGRASGKTFYSTWAHTYLIELASALLADPAQASHHVAWRELLRREVDIARNEQAAEGGWGYYDFNHIGQNPSGNESTSFNTSAMIECMLNARAQGVAPVPGAVEDGVKCVLRMRVPSGAFAYGTYAELNLSADYNKISGSSGRLQVCNLALFRTDVPGVDGETLLRGVEHLRDTHHYIEIARGRVRPHEAFYRCSGYYYFFGHYYCARVLQLAPAGARRDMLTRWLTDQMVVDQNKDGSWFDYPLYGYGFAYATGFAMRTLELTIPMLQEQVQAADAGK